MRAWLGAVTAASSLLGGCQGRAPAPVAAAGPQGPGRIAGLWQETLTRDGVVPPMVGRARVCLSPTAAAEMSPLATGLRRRACARSAQSREPDGSERFTMRCDLGEGGVSDIEGRLARPSASHFTLREQSVTRGAAMPMMNGRHVIVIDGSWLGPCPRGMAPGEVALGGGLNLNLSRAAAAIEALGGK